MRLITDYANPFELSVAARAGADNEERERNKLSDVLPTQPVDGLTVALESGADGRVEVAEYRAFDAENAFGNAGARGRRQIVELAPLGQQARVSEYDRLVERARTTPQAIKDVLGRRAIHLGRAVADRLELARGEVLRTGGLNINENEIIGAAVDFGRDEDMEVTAAVNWADAGADWITELNSWMNAYADKNGELPETMIVSRKVLSVIKASDATQSIFAVDGAYTRRITTEDIQQFLVDEGLPRIATYDRKVVKNGQSVDVLDPNGIIFAPSASLNAGSTALGTTLESQSPRYGIPVGEEAGIVVGAFESDNPMGLYLNASAIGLPVLHDANRFMSATVITG